MQASVKLLGHIINEEGVPVNPLKIEAIGKLSKADLMEEDGCTPSV